MEPTPSEPSATDEEALSDVRLPLTELEPLNARLPSWRKRGVQLALLSLALCVGLAATWSVLFPKRQTTPSTPPPIPITALLVSNLTNATITLNGKKLAGYPPMAVSADLLTDEVTIAAPLFRPHTCHFKGLVTEEDTTGHCLFTTNNGFAQNAPSFVIGVYLTPDDLLQPQKNQIIAPLMQQVAIVQQTITQPGDSIATAFASADYTITSRQTTTPLQAIVGLEQVGPRASISPPFPYPFSPACEQLFCPLGFGPAPPYQAPAGQVWGLVLNVMLHWRFTDGTGATIADVTYPPDLQAGFVFDLPQVQFVYDAIGWHPSADTNLSARMPAFLCDTGMAILEQRVLAPGVQGVNIGPLTNRGVEGCLISLQAKGGSGLLLWRYGVLLAADAGAHTILPDLPIASPAAIAAVRG